MFDGKIIISIKFCIGIHPLDLKKTVLRRYTMTLGGIQRNWILLYESEFSTHRKGTKIQNGQQNACLGPKSVQAADKCERLSFVCKELSLVCKNEFLNNATLDKPLGNTPTCSINICECQIDPSGPSLAQTNHFGALCKKLETLCNSVKVLGATTPSRQGLPNYGSTANCGGKCPSKWGPFSTNGIMGHPSSSKGCQPWRPIIMCHGSG